MKDQEFVVGDIVEHFKREYLSEEERNKGKYLYQIKSIGMHTETEEAMITYQELTDPFDTFIRPYDMFVSKIDNSKYPTAGTYFRFNKIIHFPLVFDNKDFSYTDWEFDKNLFDLIKEAQSSPCLITQKMSGELVNTYIAIPDATKGNEGKQYHIIGISDDGHYKYQFSCYTNNELWRISLFNQKCLVSEFKKMEFEKCFSFAELIRTSIRNNYLMRELMKK